MCKNRPLIAQLALPIVLVAVGILLLIGCIPVPATRQLQPDNRLRPEHYVGTGEHDPVQLGHTTITRAFIELSKRTGATIQFDSSWFSGSSSTINPMWSMLHWTVSSNHREFAVQYDVRKTTWIMPLCFHAEQETERRWLTLIVNDDDVVVRAVSSDREPPGLLRPTLPQWLEIFDPAQRAELRAAGVFPDDAMIDAVAHFQEQAKQRAAERRNGVTTSRFSTTRP